MKKLTTRWYYSLEELIEMINEHDELDWHIYQDGIRNDDNTEEGFGGMLDILMENHIYSLAGLDNTEGKKMFTSYL